MTLINGREPDHWHKDVGGGKLVHNMPDPRTFDLAAVHWTDDERGFVAHLEQHEHQRTQVEPLPTDPDLLTAVLAYITRERAILDTFSELVFAVRQELAEGVTEEDSQAIKALAEMWQRLRRTRTPEDDER